MGLKTQSGPPRAYLDANVIIRFVENEDPGLQFLFEQGTIGKWDLVTSEMTLAEVLVTPLRERDDRLSTIYDELLSGGESLEIVPVSRAVLRRSAEIRALLGNKGVDAIHIATAIEANCSAFVSSDLRLRLPNTVRQIPIERVLDLERWP